MKETKNVLLLSNCSIILNILYLSKLKPKNMSLNSNVPLGWEEHKVLIWGKTYPELSSKYYETVCTGGTLEDGRFIRLYPIPFRYLEDDVTFTKYQWVTLNIKKATDDPRPESYKVDVKSIRTGEKLLPGKSGWNSRFDIIFKNKKHIFESVEDLIKMNKDRSTSLGFVKPKSILGIEVDERPESEYNDFIKKLEANKKRSKQTEIFGPITVQDLKSLQFVSKRFKVHWACNNPECKTHHMSILDWEAYELVRRVGIDIAREKLTKILDLTKYDIGFFLGNFRLYQNTFAIGGIWYPKRSKNTETINLFNT